MVYMQKSDGLLLPKWVMKRYLLLDYELGKRREFTFKESVAILSQIGDDARIVTLLLSELRKSGWLETRPSEKDARMRTYILKPHETIFENYVTNMLENSKGKK